MKWILILLIFNDKTAGLTSAEFESEFACQQSISEIRRQIVYGTPQWGVQYACVEKNRQPGN